MSKRSSSIHAGPPTICALVMPKAFRMMLRRLLFVTVNMPPGVMRTDDGPPSLFTLIEATSKVLPAAVAGGACAPAGGADATITVANARAARTVRLLIAHLPDDGLLRRGEWRVHSRVARVGVGAGRTWPREELWPGV